MSRFGIVAAFAALTATWMIPATAFFAPVSHADSLTPTERQFVQQYGADPLCTTIAKYHSIGGVVGVVKGVMDQGFTASEAVTVVNYSVATYCPTWYPLLQETGAYFRGQQQGQRV